MKWLRENWIIIVLIIVVLFIGYGWRNNIQNNREYREVVKKYETDISLKRDSIIILKKALKLEMNNVAGLERDNDELDAKIRSKENEISLKDMELEKERQSIKDLPATSQIDLLSENLSEEMGEVVKLKLKSVRGDTLVDLEVKHVEIVNIVFVEKKLCEIKLIDMSDLLTIKEDKIDTQDLLILSHENSIDLLNKTVTQKDGIITDKDSVIKEMKKSHRRNKVKYFFIGFGTGILTGIGITLI